MIDLHTDGCGKSNFEKGKVYKETFTSHIMRNNGLGTIKHS